MLQAQDPAAVAVYAIFASGTFPDYCPVARAGRCTPTQLVSPSNTEKLLAAEAELAKVTAELTRARVMNAAQKIAGAKKGVTGRFINDPTLLANPAAIGCKTSNVAECFWELAGVKAREWSRDFGRDPLSLPSSSPAASPSTGAVRGGRPAPLLEPDDVLKGHKQIAVYANVSGTRSITVEEVEELAAAVLSRGGVTVKPHTELIDDYPLLRIDIDTFSGTLGGSTYWSFDVNVQFRQLFTVTGADGKPASVRATTWSDGSYGATGGLVLISTIKEHIADIVRDFAAIYTRVNR